MSVVSVTTLVISCFIALSLLVGDCVGCGIKLCSLAHCSLGIIVFVIIITMKYLQGMLQSVCEKCKVLVVGVVCSISQSIGQFIDVPSTSFLEAPPTSTCN